MTSTPPRWYWIVAALATLWMLFGVMALAMDAMMDDAALAALTDGQRQLYEMRPQWIFVVYAIAVCSGLAGAAGLLVRKTWATPVLAVSLVAVTIQFSYTLIVMDAVGLLGTAAALPFPLTIWVIGAATLWFSTMARRRGWLSA